MEPFESTTHSFIVKIWLEESADESTPATWRGHITHVPSGERRYLDDLGEISAFIAPYLIRMGVRLEGEWQIWEWLTGRAPPSSANR